MSRRWMKIAVFATVVLAFVLRVWHLDVRSIWFDEAFSWTLSSFGPLEIIQRTGSDCHPPFYYLMLWGWIKLFGDSLWAMRLLSAVCGTAAVWVAWRVGKEAIEWTSPPVEKADSDPGIATGDLVGLMFAMFVASSVCDVIAGVSFERMVRTAGITASSDFDEAADRFCGFIGFDDVYAQLWPVLICCRLCDADSHGVVA